MKSLGTIAVVVLVLVACGPAADAYPLAEGGPYHVGMRTVKYVDEESWGSPGLRHRVVSSRRPRRLNHHRSRTATPSPIEAENPTR